MYPIPKEWGVIHAISLRADVSTKITGNSSTWETCLFSLIFQLVIYLQQGYFIFSVSILYTPIIVGVGGYCLFGF